MTEADTGKSTWEVGLLLNFCTAERKMLGQKIFPSSLPHYTEMRQIKRRKTNLIMYVWDSTKNWDFWAVRQLRLIYRPELTKGGQRSGKRVQGKMTRTDIWSTLVCHAMQVSLSDTAHSGWPALNPLEIMASYSTGPRQRTRDTWMRSPSAKLRPDWPSPSLGQRHSRATQLISAQISQPLIWTTDKGKYMIFVLSTKFWSDSNN